MTGVLVLARKRFNPRARDGREVKARLKKFSSDVSIHAPVMDANTPNEVRIRTEYVSIHAPVMDANIKGLEPNITHRVSIHAPVMDAKRSV